MSLLEFCILLFVTLPHVLGELSIRNKKVIDYKSTDYNMASEKQRSSLTKSISVLFYLSSILGLIPYSLPVYARNKIFKISIIGNIWSILFSIAACVQYHFIIGDSMDEKNEPSTLTVLIGLVLVYMEPLMLAADVIGFLVNQKPMIALLDRMQKVDDKLLKENIEINYSNTRRLTIILVILGTILEICIIMYNIFLFPQTIYRSLYSFISVIPLYISTCGKIWYILMVYNVKQKFSAINTHFENTGLFIEEMKKKTAKKFQDFDDDFDYFNNRRMSNNDIDGSSNPSRTGGGGGGISDMNHGGYLHKEIHSKPLFKRTHKIHNQQNSMPNRSKFTSGGGGGGIVHVLPANDDYLTGNTKKSSTATTITSSSTTTMSTQFGSIDIRSFLNEIPFNENNRFVVDTKLNKKLTRLCQLHDEICDIGKAINQMFSFQMLLLMAYGFMSLTAKFYFVYCGMTGQYIPALFRSAQSIPMSVLFIVYTGSKCVYVIYTSWQTKLVAQKTGVKIHKVANVVDEDQCYQIVNHLSLKLLNHHLSFTACGFFELDMTTLYAITGAITSYLIILIQFNLAAQRSKKQNALNSTMTSPSSMASSTTMSSIL